MIEEPRIEPPREDVAAGAESEIYLAPGAGREDIGLDEIDDHAEEDGDLDDEEADEDSDEDVDFGEEESEDDDEEEEEE